MLLSNNIVLAIARLPLKRPSSWRVYLALVTHGPEAELNIAELAIMTGISVRSVKGALRVLRQLNLVYRDKRRLIIRTPPPVVSSRSLFTGCQERAISRLLHRGCKLLDIKTSELGLPDPVVDRLGLTPPMSAIAVYEALKLNSTALMRREYVRSLIELVNSEQVRGHAL